MATIIDKTYFSNGLATIPQLSNPITGTAIQNELQAFIDVYEVRFIDRLLGRTLRKALYAGLEETTPDARWTVLAAKLADGTSKISPIAYYVAHYWADTHQTIETVTGSMLIENHTVNFAKIEQRWNAMRELLVDFVEWWDSDGYIDYPEVESSEMNWTVLFTSVNQFDI